MARTNGQQPDVGPDDFKRQSTSGADTGGSRPAFFVNSDGVATPGNLVRGEGFTMRPGAIWPPYRRRGRNLH